ncbi:MAG: serine/threonine protein kinase [Deltaproteobacteria bacterium]|nr:serine/threonine protein kinase [Nannocystaceae bacterium]
MSRSPHERAEHTVIGMPPAPHADARAPIDDPLEHAETVIARAPARPEINREGFSSRFGEGFDAAPDGLTGMTLAGRYRLVRVLGEGGMGRIYEALEVGTQARLAVKVLADELCGDPRQVQRFIREAKTASRIESDHVVAISDSGVTPTGAVYFAMELLEGEDLATTIHRDGPMPWSRVRHIMLQLCAALGSAHACQVVHRDIKPHNCFRITRRGDTDFVKVFDFGIAKLLGEHDGSQLTRTGQIFGTPEYMSPEQIRGEPVDPRMDVYAAGVILFELLCARPPFESDDPLTVISRHLAEPVPDVVRLRRGLATPPGLGEVISRALAKDLASRYPSAEAFAQAIAALVIPEPRGKTQLAPAIPVVAPVGAIGTRTVVLAVSVVALAIMLVIAASWAVVGH